MRQAHRFLCARHRVLHERRVRELDGNGRGLSPTIHRLERREGEHHEAVERLTENFPLARDHADDREPFAANANLAPHGIDRLEELLSHLRSNDTYETPLAYVHVAQRLARGEPI